MVTLASLNVRDPLSGFENDPKSLKGMQIARDNRGKAGKPGKGKARSEKMRTGAC